MLTEIEMNSSTLNPIPFSSFGGYRAFCDAWWKDLWRTITYGWWHDVKTYWCRARYGWAPRDTWSLDHYLAKVIGGSLGHLAEKTHSYPSEYTYDEWVTDLRKWAKSFDDYCRDDYVELYGDEPDYKKWNADEKARSEALHQALKEMEPWFEGLWD